MKNKLLVLLALIGLNELIIAEHGRTNRSSSSGRSYNRSNRDYRRGNYNRYNRSSNYNDGYRNRRYYNDGYYDNGEGLAVGLLAGTAIAATAAAANND